MSRPTFSQSDIRRAQALGFNAEVARREAQEAEHEARQAERERRDAEDLEDF